MKGRTPTTEEQQYMDRVRDLGCIVCRLFHGEESPAEIHHLEGKVNKGAHFQIIGLCYHHHRDGKRNGMYVSRHPHKTEFERRYGAEQELLEKTLSLLGVDIHC